MLKFRLQKSLADYVAIAICPVLIMLLVGSLVFFLLAVFYSGRFEIRLHWIMFWFVFASVLIARIAIEHGSESAGLYGLLLAIATALVIFRYVDAPVVALILLAVIWWCTNKLTWDSTLIDDSEDSSGEGLLQASRLAELADSTNAPPLAAAQESTASARWMHLLGMHVRQEGKPHAPGMWVVYFSIATLPLFGLGQLGLDKNARGYGFQLLWVYVASALGILLLTSFLGLRRYLRQRRLRMPKAMAGTWIGMGVTLILAILLFCILLPRPESDYSVATWINEASSLAQEASDFALLRGDSGEGTGQRKGQTGDDQASEEPEASDTPTESTDPESEATGATQDSDDEKAKADDKNDQGSSGEKQQMADDEQQPRTASNSNLFNWKKWVGILVKCILWGTIALVCLYFLRRHWSQLVESIKRWWNSLFAQQTPEADDNKDKNEKSPPPRPFSSFRDPFVAGAAKRMSVAELVRYSFDALQAWAEEQNCGRDTDQTPLEFGQRLGADFTTIAHESQQLTQLYSRIAYADQTLGRDCLSTLEQLWRKMTTAQMERDH